MSESLAVMDKRYLDFELHEAIRQNKTLAFMNRK